jgi:hypothetical protein
LTDAGQSVELPGGWLDVSPDGWLGGMRQLGVGQVLERGTGGGPDEHADESLFGGM